MRQTQGRGPGEGGVWFHTGGRLTQEVRAPLASVQKSVHECSRPRGPQVQRPWGRKEGARKAEPAVRRGGEAVRARDREGVASGEPRGGGMTRSPAAVSTGGPRLKEGDQARGPGREAGRDGGGPGRGGAGGRRCKREEDSGERTRPEARPEGAGESPGRAPAGSSAPQTRRRKAEFSRESLLGSALRQSPRV